MNKDTMRRLVFGISTCVLVLPWLTPCTLGIGTVASSLINRATIPLAAGPLDHLPHADLKQWAARPGPMLEVQSRKYIHGSQLIRDDELLKHAAKAPRPGSKMSGKASNIVGFLSTLLAITDASSRGILEGEGDDSSIVDYCPGSVADQRRQLALNEFPFVLLQGEELPYRKQEKQPWPRIARASINSKVTVITPDGTFFGIAQRIHFRSGTTEVILEGNPTVQSGSQHIKGAKSDAIMKLDFVKRRVTVSGPVIEQKLFY